MIVKHYSMEKVQGKFSVGIYRTKIMFDNEGLELGIFYCIFRLTYDHITMFCKAFLSPSPMVVKVQQLCGMTQCNLPHGRAQIRPDLRPLIV